MTKEMLINTVEGQECRIAIVQDGLMEELYVERTSSASQVGNIYKGRVTNVEPAIQAAFVDFGHGKNGFLHVSDVHPQYFPKGRQESEAVGKKRSRRDRPPIQDCLRRGSEVVVQLTKAGIGTKGPTLTTYLSIPGRLLVLMPGMSRLGVSRKIEDEADRAKARAALEEIKLPDDAGIIVRTAGTNISKRELQRDLNYLTRLWKAAEQRIKTSRAPAEIYQESDLVTRTIRDVYGTDIERIVCDSRAVAEKVREFLQVAVPRNRSRIELYVGKGGLYHDFGLEEEIEKIHSRQVELPSGGSIVIDQTEALVAIDVNSGRFRRNDNAETTALKVDLEAAAEIGRQLRLRDIGGLIVIDFIDLYDLKNRRKVEKVMRDATKNDRAKTKILAMSNFGIVQMTRQRIGPSLKAGAYRRCAHCDGGGLIKSEESLALLIMRDLQRATANDDVARVEISVTGEVAHHLANYHRREIADLESNTGREIIIHADPGLVGDEVNFACFNARGSDVAWQQAAAGPSGRTVPLEQVESEAQAPADVEEAQKRDSEPAEDAQPAAKKKKSRRGRRGGRKRKKSADEAETKDQDHDETQDDTPPGGTDEAEESGEAEKTVESAAPTAKKKTRRGRRGGRKHKKSDAEPKEQSPAESEEQPPARADESEKPQESGESAEADESAAPAAKKKTRRGRRGGRKHKKSPAKPEQTTTSE